MSPIAEAISPLEYNTLREEMLQNKRYVFERPLLIIAAVSAGFIQFSGNEPVVLLPLLLVIVLLINLWFTANRLRSSSRISAYIDVVLESNRIEWMGWERSLRLWRICKKKHTPEEIDELIKPYINPDAIPDAMMFYPPIYWFHVAITMIAVSMSGILVIQGFSNASSNEFMKALSIIAFSLTLLISIVFAYYCTGPYHPRKMRDLIEKYRATWMLLYRIKPKPLSHCFAPQTNDNSSIYPQNIE